jgi:hypothetical protein
MILIKFYCLRLANNTILAFFRMGKLDTSVPILENLHHSSLLQSNYDIRRVDKNSKSPLYE